VPPERFAELLRGGLGCLSRRDSLPMSGTR
jgi:hypothetical protein